MHFDAQSKHTGRKKFTGFICKYNSRENISSNEAESPG